MHRILLLLPILGLTACGQEPFAPGHAPTAPTSIGSADAPDLKFNQRTSVVSTAYSGCTGEIVQISGTLHVTVTQWLGSDGWRQKVHINSNLSGVGTTSGRRYVFLQITNNRTEFDVPAGITVTDQVFHFLVISQGSAANQYLTMNGMWVFSPSGVQFIPKKWEFVCR